VKTALIIASLVVLGGSIGVIFASRDSQSAVSLGPSPNVVGTTTRADTTLPAPASLEVWFASSTRIGEQLVRVRRTHEATPRVATAAIEELLSGPSRAERASGFFSAIPAGTRLLGISINDGVATIDLTSEYQSGGGSLSMYFRLGQVVYTLTQFPTVKKVSFRLDGTPVNVFSSEGIVLSQPVGRDDYKDLLPVIVVARPTAGSRVTSPVTVSGSANVFEANVTVKVLDASGKVLRSTFTTATCGTGCRGTYSVDVRFRSDREQRGTIVVSDDDAAGVGRPPHEVRVPVVLVPSQ
jgi:Immunoglobulin-like domain of bacterial spore germination/Sporulation and spore germination